ncbi:MAG: exopolysaccharide Pel transporter PelG, partial [Acidobacteriota bacterium]
MAGIGFELRKLARRDDLLGVLQGLAHSSLASTGPWLFTILSLSTVFLFGSRLTGYEELVHFRLIIIYNFAFSLVMSGPLVMLTTRCLADQIFEKNTRNAPSMLLGAISVLYLTQLPVAVYFYFFYFSLEPMARVAGFVDFFLITGIWLTSVFLTALKDYKSVTYSFGCGMLLATVGAIQLAGWYGHVGMLFGFNLGLAWIMFSLVARVFAEYPHPLDKPFDFLRTLRPYWEIALGGLV